MIQGEPDVHVHTGVSLKLHCTVELATEPPLYIFWFHNDSMINYAPKRPLKVMKHNFGSSLIINNVTWDDAGSYRCEPHKAKAANLTLHVVEGEGGSVLTFRERLGLIFRCLNKESCGSGDIFTPEEESDLTRKVTVRWLCLSTLSVLLSGLQAMPSYTSYCAILKISYWTISWCLLLIKGNIGGALT